MKRIAFYSALVVAALGFASGAFAQTGTARGKVLDEKGQPVEGAVIKIEYQGGVTRAYETKSNKRGEYTQVGLQPGDYKFTASKEGYQGAFAEAKINLGDPTYLPDLKINSAAAKQAEASAANEELQALFKKGFEAAQAQNYAEAIAAYQEALVKRPDLAQAHFNLGYVYAQQKDWPNAEASMKKALELKPDYTEANAALAGIYGDSGQTEKAAALASASNDPRILIAMGVTHINKNEPDKAKEYLLKAEAADPTQADIQYYLGSIALQQNNQAEAMTRLEKFLSLNPTNATYKEAAEKLVAALKQAAAAPKQ
jgi:tetratricopeptide (TPR) repeat protein